MRDEAPKKRRRKGTGSIYFRPGRPAVPAGDGKPAKPQILDRWVYEEVLPRGADGKAKKRLVYDRTLAGLKRKVADLRARTGGQLVPVDRRLVSDFVAHWLENEVKPNKSPATYAGYDRSWRLAAPLIGGVRLSELTSAHVDYLYSTLRKTCSTDAVQRVARVLTTAFEAAIRRGDFAGANPFRQVERPRHAVKEGRTLTPEEARRFLDALRGDRYEALWSLLLLNGLRIGEALGLTWETVDLDAGTVTILRSVGEVDGRGIVVGPTKTKASRRRVVLDPMALEPLRRRLASAKDEGHSHPTDAVFCTTTGTLASQHNLRRRSLAPILKRASLNDVTPHTLRHTATSFALASGRVGPKDVAAMLGHATTRMTLDRYGHVLPGSGAHVAGAIANTLRAPKADQPRKRKRSIRNRHSTA
jgi:integrase